MPTVNADSTPRPSVLPPFRLSFHLCEPRCTGACVFDSSFLVGFLRSPPSEWSRVRSAASSVARVCLLTPLLLRTTLCLLFSSSPQERQGEVGQSHLSRCPKLRHNLINTPDDTNTYNAISNRGRPQLGAPRRGRWRQQTGVARAAANGGGGGGVVGHNLTRHYMRVLKEVSESLKAVAGAVRR